MTLPPALALAVLTAPAHARLAYVKGEAQIHVANDDGSQPRRIATGIAPVISPDGRWVAYLRTARQERRSAVVRTSGGPSRRVARSTEVC